MRTQLRTFFYDQKRSLSQKEAVWLIELNKKIVWILGFRIEDCFKVLFSTKKILKIEFK